ncbi:MAG TPA: tRNA (adenine-N1)-methyltransferase [Actinomycetota bacterium]
MPGPFVAGERVLFLDVKNRRFLIRLEAGGTFHFHGGQVPHDDVIGREEGLWLETNTGARVVCFRPRLADFVVKMARGAQVVYPKDIGAILVEADIGAGASVLEAGTGSAAVTMALARAVGHEGRVVSYEVREPFHHVAKDNLAAFFGEVPAWVDLRIGDVREVPEAERFDRLVLDLPEPEAVLPETAAALRPGGILCSYLPTTGQVQELVLSLRPHGFIESRTFEVLMRTWHVEARSVRPDHRMVAHTGFLTVARKAGPKA